MRGIQFEEEQHYDRAPFASRRDLSGWLVQKGLAADRTSADRSLLVTLVLVVTLIVGVLVFAGRGNTLDDVDSRAIREAWPGNFPLQSPPHRP